MNSLSYLIYWIGVIDSLGMFGLWLAIPGTLGLAIVIIFWLIFSGVSISEMGTDAHYQTKPEQWTSYWKWWAKGRNIAAACWFVGWLIIIFVPSRQTLLLIAGSQMTELALKSNTVQEVVNPGLDLLKSWIKEETDKLKPKPKSRD